MQLEEGSYQNLDNAGILLFNFYPLALWETNFIVCKPASLWYSVTAAQDD